MAVYEITRSDGQAKLHDYASLEIPSYMPRFIPKQTLVEWDPNSSRRFYIFDGALEEDPEERICVCGAKMHIHKTTERVIRHEPIGHDLTFIRYNQITYRCPECGALRMQEVPFKAIHHRMSVQLEAYTEDLLETEQYTLKEVSEITGLGKNIVKEVDLSRLKAKFLDLNGKIKKPEKTAKVLGIDEFSLHGGREYATHIIDLVTGHVLWIQRSKKKQVVYDFIEHVGLDWMSHVQVVTCDMNSDFSEAFLEKCPHLTIVYDHFHIVKNFNDKVMSEIRKDEQKRLIEEGNLEAAEELKGSRFILLSKVETLKKKDQNAKEGHVIHKGSSLLGTEDVVQKGGNMDKFDKLISENELLLTAYVARECVDVAYKVKDRETMIDKIDLAIYLCRRSGNEHLLWFANLLDNHYDGIISYADYPFTNAKEEGLNQKIKTIRRQGYGYPDDDYFFLKVIESSYRVYHRNPKITKIAL